MSKLHYTTSDERRTNNLKAGRTVDGKFEVSEKTRLRSLFNPTPAMKRKQAAKAATWAEFFCDEPVLVMGM